MSYSQSWKQLASMSFSSMLSTRIDSATYFIGKAIRFFFFWVFIVSLFQFTETIGGYTRYEVLLFFLTFNVLDVGSQFFFRGIYVFRNQVKQGHFDMTLTKPISPLFLIFSRIIDFLDLLFLIPVVALLAYVIQHIPTITASGIFLYGIFLIFSCLLILAIHILSAAVIVYTQESDNVFWLYRETMTIGRLPPTIFSGTIQWFFVYIIPIIIIVAYPVRALLNEIVWQDICIAGIMTILFLGISLFIWKLCLRAYASASS